MEEIKTDTQQPESMSKAAEIFDLRSFYTTVLLNWKWFVLSAAVCLCGALVYLRYTTPVYRAYAKMLIKTEDSRKGGGSALAGASVTGSVSFSNGLDNEMEILSSHSLAEQVVGDLHLYVTYSTEGRIKEAEAYKTVPVYADVDVSHRETLAGPVRLQIVREGSKYHITGSYTVPVVARVVCGIDKTVDALPATIATKAGIITLTPNPSYRLTDGQMLKVTIVTPHQAAYKYRAAFSVSQSTKSNNIVSLGINDEIPERALDYLSHMVVAYNRRANEDKNEVARRTEEFINGRLEKINAELGSTESALENYKKRNNMVELRMNASQAMGNADQYDQKLAEAQTQLALMESVEQSMSSGEKYSVLPANIGISDGAVNGLIDRYNELALRRRNLLRSASETSPTIVPITNMLDDLGRSISAAMVQARRSFEITRNSIARQYNKYAGQITETPEQERILSQIGRQQEVKSGLYLMLLQKREENSISLAATADKGRLIDQPEMAGMISPQRGSIMGMALLIGLLLPALVVVILQLLRYKIEGHADVEKLTRLPILADVAVASDTAKGKADIVVHENKNNQMEEIFRSMRTNLQFMLSEGQRVVLFTSTTSGEGKTFNAANLAISFALLGKRVILVGLDIRKPRMAELFEIEDHYHGITPLLAKQSPTWEDVQGQTVASGVNNNLELLMAGPIPPNPAEMVARPSLDSIIDMLKAHYDYVIIDTAPVGLVTDTLQIGRVADATVYVCRADYTPKNSFDFINALADQHKLPRISLVLNGIDMSRKKYGYYYGYGKYGKYGKYGGKKGYSSYGNYGAYGNYSKSHYGDKNDTSVKR